MALRQILTEPNAILREKSVKVDLVDSDIKKLMDDMLQTMYAAPGIGLAAIQVGVPKRVIVLDISQKGQAKSPMFFINPEIIEKSNNNSTYEEGCLSVPGLRGKVSRPNKIKYTGLDIEGNKIETIAEGFDARVVQHECDHLFGILYPQRMDDLSSLQFVSEARHWKE